MTLRFWALFLGLLACVLTALPARADGEAGSNLLEDKSPLRSKGVRREDALTDGKAAKTGDFWKTHLSARFAKADSFVVYDLGSEQQIAAAWLQGDNNDFYELAVSNDGVKFEVVWRAPPGGGSGLQPRHTTELAARGRFLRISASGGDGSYALSEVQVFAAAPEPFPPRVRELTGVPLEQRVRDKALLFGIALIMGLLLAHQRAGRWWILASLVWPLVAGWQFWEAVRDAWPLEQREVSLVRGVLATVAAVAVLREAFAPARLLAHRKIVVGVLGLCGVLGFLAFYNLGHPQFWDARKQEWTFVHFLDLRQYYPTAKYFDELGYRGMYEADIAAYSESEPSKTLDALGNTPMRDLDDLKMSTVERERLEIERIRSQFSAERWEEYKRDSEYFRRTMGTSHFLDTMHDMGGNATPVWMSIAHVLFNAFNPSNGAFLLTGLLDPLLLLLAFFAIGRTFGARTAFVCMVVFGANDFIMYGTNWGGATLRHDWLAYIGLGACALKAQRWVLGGALLALSSMIRAFPALTLVALTFPMLWWIGEHAKQHRRFPGFKLIAETHRPVMRVMLGAVGTVVVLFAFSAIVLPIESWKDWLIKVGQLSSDPHGNHISLRSLIAGWEDDQNRVLRARMPLFVFAVAAYIVAVFIAARKKPLEQAAILGLILIPVIFYPANYYIHFVFLLPLLATERRAEGGESRAPRLAPLDGGLCAIVLIMCAAQYWTVLVTTRGLHFYLASVLLFAALTSIVILLVRQQAVAAGWFAVVPELAGAPSTPALAALSPVVAAEPGASGAEPNADLAAAAAPACESEAPRSSPTIAAENTSEAPAAAEPAEAPSDEPAQAR